jgi:hypothetical protein
MYMSSNNFPFKDCVLESMIYSFFQFFLMLHHWLASQEGFNTKSQHNKYDNKNIL